LRKILYPVTPVLSVEAIHVSLTCVADTAIAVIPVGLVGGVVSVGGGDGGGGGGDGGGEPPPLCVVALVAVDRELAFPAASYAATV